jgi:hypothetical protein
VEYVEGETSLNFVHDPLQIVKYPVPADRHEHDSVPAVTEVPKVRRKKSNGKTKKSKRANPLEQVPKPHGPVHTTAPSTDFCDQPNDSVFGPAEPFIGDDFQIKLDFDENRAAQDRPPDSPHPAQFDHQNDFLETHATVEHNDPIGHHDSLGHQQESVLAADDLPQKPLQAEEPREIQGIVQFDDNNNLEQSAQKPSDQMTTPERSTSHDQGTRMQHSVDRSTSSNILSEDLLHKKNGRSRVSKPSSRNTNTSRAKSTTSGDQRPSMLSAIQIIQFTWDKEQQEFAQERAAEAERHIRKVSELEQGKAVLLSQLEASKTANEELQSKSQGDGLKFGDLSAKLAKLAKFANGLAMDLGKEKAVSRNFYDQMIELRTEASSFMSEYTEERTLLSRSVDEYRSLMAKYRDELAKATDSIEKALSEKALLKKEVADIERLLAEERVGRCQDNSVFLTQTELQEKSRALAETNQRELLQRLEEVKGTMQTLQPEPENAQLNDLSELLQEVHSRNVVAPEDIKSVERLVKSLEDRSVFDHPTILQGLLRIMSEVLT